LLKKELDVIRRNIQTCKGEKVRLTARGGRKRIIVHEGIIEEIYDNVFVLKCRESGEINRKITFSYIDILTRTVDFTLYKNDQQLRLTF
jgi:uncharacterized protein Veg